jgi:hypothetical protein
MQIRQTTIPSGVAVLSVFNVGDAYFWQIEITRHQVREVFKQDGISQNYADALGEGWQRQDLLAAFG